MAKLIRTSGWNKPIKALVYVGFRTIEANSLDEAIEYMNKYYNGFYKDAYNTNSRYYYYNSCHHVNGSEYTFIVSKVSV